MRIGETVISICSRKQTTVVSAGEDRMHISSFHFAWTWRRLHTIPTWYIFSNKTANIYIQGISHRIHSTSTAHSRWPCSVSALAGTHLLQKLVNWPMNVKEGETWQWFSFVTSSDVWPTSPIHYTLNAQYVLLQMLSHPCIVVYKPGWMNMGTMHIDMYLMWLCVVAAVLSVWTARLLADAGGAVETEAKASSVSSPSLHLC